MNSLRFLRVPLWNTIKYRGLLSKLDKYGNIFTNPEEERCRVQQWPTTGWRNMEDGLSGGDNTTSGNFTLYWKDNRFYATNSGVKDGDYCFAWNRLTSFLHENTNIEYHHYHLHDYNNIYFHNEIK